jgi:hypothetical protein
MSRRLVIASVVGVLCVACASESRIGDVTLVPPEGWHVTERTENSIKVTNGSIGSDTSTKPGTATAVFDVYVDSSQTVDEFEEALDEYHVDPDIDRMRLDGYRAVLVSYETSGFGPSTEVVFVPEWKVRIVYRAAYPKDESAFTNNRAAFRKALRTIRFSGRPPTRAWGPRGAPLRLGGRPATARTAS